jgi:hypothetical protein
MSIQIEILIDKLVADPRLRELMEIAKSGNDAFYLVDPLENQNSDILAWCFNSQEGHDQGDSVLKDFLIAIYQAATEMEAGDRLGGRKDSKMHTKSFVVDWTPSRIAASSFGSTFCLREYHLSVGRIDLMIVDPEHKFIVAVENKVGDRLTAGQLAKYFDELSHEFGGYQKAFVALDYYHDSDDDNNKNAANNKWVVLDYGWLSIAGSRAEHAIKRGNKAASLLKSYCEMLTSGESYDKETRRLIHSLAQDYRDVFQILKPLRLKKGGKQKEVQIGFWKALNKSDQTAYLLRMYQQSPFLWDQLIDLRPIDLLDFEIRNSLNLDETNCVVYRSYSCYRTPSIDSISLNSDLGWPVYIIAGHNASKSTDEPMFDVWISLRQLRFISEKSKNESIEKIQSAFPESKIRLDVDQTRICKSQNLNQADALKAIMKLEEKLRDAFAV